MGVDRKTYVVLGLKLDYKAERAKHGDQLYEKYVETKLPAPLECVYDGMCGEYILLGKVLVESGSRRWGDDEFPFTRIADGPWRTEVRKALQELGFESPDIGLYVFQHYS
jgi:hypothetical protein